MQGTMKKVYMMEDLGCANCAAKMEAAIAKLDGVEQVQINFMRQSLTLQAQDELFEDVLKKTKKIIRKIEPDVTLQAN